MSRGHTGCEALSRLRDEARVGRFELELSDRDVRVQISFSALRKRKVLVDAGRVLSDGVDSVS
jgi:hypothetical protein